MIRKTLFILISGLLLTACNTPEKEKQETTDNAPETKKLQQPMLLPEQAVNRQSF